jgi:hypothetical protein
MLAKLTCATLAGLFAVCSPVWAEAPIRVTKNEFKPAVQPRKTHEVVARCPPNTTVIGGGFEIIANVPIVFAVQKSAPDGPIQGPTLSLLPGWSVEVVNTDVSKAWNSNLTVYAICL